MFLISLSSIYLSPFGPTKAQRDLSSETLAYFSIFTGELALEAKDFLKGE